MRIWHCQTNTQKRSHAHAHRHTQSTSEIKVDVIILQGRKKSANGGNEWTLSGEISEKQDIAKFHERLLHGRHDWLEAPHYIVGPIIPILFYSRTRSVSVRPVTIQVYHLSIVTTTCH